MSNKYIKPQYLPIQNIVSGVKPLNQSHQNIVSLAPKLAQRWLRSNLAGAREIAAHIGVVDRMIYKWANGEAPIPLVRAENILLVCKRFKRPLDQLEEETNAYLASRNDLHQEKGAA